MLATWKNLGDDGLTTGDITDGTPAERRPAVSSTRPPVSLMPKAGVKASRGGEQSRVRMQHEAGVKAGSWRTVSGVDPA